MISELVLQFYIDRWSDSEILSKSEKSYKLFNLFTDFYFNITKNLQSTLK